MEINKIKERFDLIAAEYDEQRRHFIPCFDDYYEIGIDFLSSFRADFKSILDLGAGTGLLTKYLYEKYPQAHYTLVDVAEQMLEVARQRFERLDNFEYLVEDYTLQLPEGNFDLIASGLSIHHLEHATKDELYLRIFERLPQNGCLLNLDQFNVSSELLNKQYNEYWHKQICLNPVLNQEKETWLKRRELDRENTIAETIDLLRSIGFQHVECIYSYMKFGVVLAIK
jgi:ubiquinone/menaquinone biosynthesis C-methylase UbiE